MAIKNTLLGGEDWRAGQTWKPIDFNNTISEVGSIINDGITKMAVPIGTIIMWDKSLTGVPTLSAGWHECDGSVLSDAESLLNGTTLPSLQAARVYLRGNATSGGTGGANTHSHSTSSGGTASVFGAVANYNMVGNPTAGTSSASSEPPYIIMVPIIRVK